MRRFPGRGPTPPPGRQPTTLRPGAARASGRRPTPSNAPHGAYRRADGALLLIAYGRVTFSSDGCPLAVGDTPRPGDLAAEGFRPWRRRQR